MERPKPSSYASCQHVARRINSKSQNPIPRRNKKDALDSRNVSSQSWHHSSTGITLSKFLKKNPSAFDPSKRQLSATHKAKSIESEKEQFVTELDADIAEVLLVVEKGMPSERGDTGTHGPYCAMSSCDSHHSSAAFRHHLEQSLRDKLSVVRPRSQQRQGCAAGSQIAGGLILAHGQ